MDNGARAKLFAGGQRLHLQHGPIDLIVAVDGSREQRQLAYAAARECFADVLPALAGELSLLRTEIGSSACGLQGAIAQAMWSACAPFASEWITPMAAVAGAVSDVVLDAVRDAVDVPKAWVSNGGDIAFHLSAGAEFRCGLIADVEHPQGDGVAVLKTDDRVRGIASSGRATFGRGGRSFSLGIADCVTVLAQTAARADAATTMIGNAVDVPGHPSIVRCPASELQLDSDLGDRAVTVEVGTLNVQDIEGALDRGLARAHQYLARGLIEGGVLFLRRSYRFFGHVPKLTTPTSGMGREREGDDESQDSQVSSGD